MVEFNSSAIIGIAGKYKSIASGDNAIIDASKGNNKAREIGALI